MTMCADCGGPITATEPGRWVHINLAAWAENPHPARPRESTRTDPRGQVG
jgi:hypothetical protein